MKISSKLNELKPADLNCNVFDVYSYGGLSMQELLCQFFTKINECIKVSNEAIDLASWLVNEGLKIEVVNKLMLWLEDGTLENLINVNLFNTLNNKIENIKSALDSSYIFLEEVYNSLDEKNWDAAFKVAIDRVATNNKPGVIILPAYKISLHKTIKIPACTVEIKGTFGKSILEFYNCKEKYAIYVDALALDENGNTLREYAQLKLEGVRLNGRKKRSGYENPITAIYFKGYELHDKNVQDCAIRDCYFFHWDTCIAGTLAWDMQFDNCRFHDGVLACDFGYQFQTNSFNDCKFSSFEQGFKFDNIDIQVFRTCDIVNIGKLIVSMYQSHVIFEDCYLEHLHDFGQMGSTNEAFASSMVFKNSKILGESKKIRLRFGNNNRNTFVVDDCYLPHGLEIVNNNMWIPLTRNSKLNNIWDDENTIKYYKTTSKYKFEYDKHLTPEENISNFKNNFPRNYNGTYQNVNANTEKECLSVSMDKWEGINVRGLKCGHMYTLKYRMRGANMLKGNTTITSRIHMDAVESDFVEKTIIFRAGLNGNYEEHYRLFNKDTDDSIKRVVVVSDGTTLKDGQIHLSTVNKKKQTSGSSDFVVGDAVILVEANTINISLYTDISKIDFDVQYIELIEGLKF